MLQAATRLMRRRPAAIVLCVGIWLIASPWLCFYLLLLLLRIGVLNRTSDAEMAQDLWPSDFAFRFGIAVVLTILIWMLAKLVIDTFRKYPI